MSNTSSAQGHTLSNHPLREPPIRCQNQKGTFGLGSDPHPRFVSVVLAPATRHSTPVIKRSLNPVFPAAQSTFDFPLYLSLASVIGGRGLEAVVWDKVGRRREVQREVVVWQAR